MDIGDKTYKEIEQLLTLFYEGSIDGDDQERLYYYFLHLDEVPEEWEADAILIRQLAIRRHCHKQRKQLEAMMQSAPPIRHRRSLRLPPMAYKTAAMLLLFVGITALIYHAWHNALLQPTAPLAMQSTPATVTQAPQHRQDHKPATITDNEIKNTANQTADRHTHTMLAENSTATLPTADAPQPDIMAITTIVQEHIPVLLAENETQIEIEQNLVADTAYMIADAEPIYNNLEMYCSTRCSSNEVSMMYFNTMGKI